MTEIVTEIMNLIMVGISMELHHTYFIFQHDIQCQKDIGLYTERGGGGKLPNEAHNPRRIQSIQSKQYMFICTIDCNCTLQSQV